jgi:hypothetical protein
MSDDLLKYTADELRAALRARQKADFAALGVCDGWERATVDLELADETTVEAGDWFRKDSLGTVRLAYGQLGGSYIRCHIYDADGAFSAGWEVRDMAVDGTPGPSGYYEAVRADLLARSSEHMGWPEVTP